jgi:hypothetical protein
MKCSRNFANDLVEGYDMSPSKTAVNILIK